MKSSSIQDSAKGHTAESYPLPGWAAIRSRFPQSTVLTWENVSLLVFIVLTGITRFWGLGMRVTSYDESLHAYYAYLLSIGRGFVHDPMMHGPLLFEATALIDRIFGASDFTARLVPALLGSAIVLVIPRLFQPWLGRKGRWAASGLFLISPYVLYYSRYIRHDLMVITWLLVAVYAVLSYLSERKEWHLYLLAAATALMFATMEITFIYLALIVLYLIARAMLRNERQWAVLRSQPEFDLVVVLVTLGAFFSSPIAILFLNPIFTRITGQAYIPVANLANQNLAWAAGAAGVRLWTLLAIFSIAAAVVGLWWGQMRWMRLLAIFLGITIPLYTTFFTNKAGLGTGLIGSLGYWISQQGVDRGSQPVYYFLIVFPFYEYLPVIGGTAGMIFAFTHRKLLSETSRLFVSFTAWWAVGLFLALTLAGEKMPWHSTHLTIPFILLTAWWLDEVIEGAWVQDPRLALRRRASQIVSCAAVIVLALMTAHTAFLTNYVNYDSAREFIDYARGAPGVKEATADIAAIAKQTGAGRNLQIAYDQAVAWPMTWYLREYPNQIFYTDPADPRILQTPVILSGTQDWTQVDRTTAGNYNRYQVIRIWWSMEDYKNLTWERIGYALTQAQMRTALWNIFWTRDYTLYSQLTGQVMDPPRTWPLQDSMHIYIRKDVPVQSMHLNLAPFQLAQAAPAVNPYASVAQNLTPTAELQPAGLNLPRNLVFAPDGSLYILDTGNSRVVKLSKEGSLLFTLGGPPPAGATQAAGATVFNQPWGIALDAKGDLYVADTWNYRILKFDGNGRFLLAWGTGGQAAEGPGRLWGPRAIATGPNGNLYITDTGNKRVVVYDPNGKFLFQFPNSGQAQLNEPVGIAFGPDEKVYVADTWNHRVVVFKADGTFVNAWPVQGWAGNSLDNKPYLAVDASSQVYLTDPENSRVVVFSAEGKPLASFGEFGSGPAGMILPTGITIGPDGYAWMTDTGNNRVAAYRLDLPKP